MPNSISEDRLMSPEQLAYLRSVDSPTIANAIETFNVQDRTAGFLGGSIRSMFPTLGVMCGYALTVTVTNSAGPVFTKDSWWAMFEALEKMPSPSVLVMKDVSGHPERVAYSGEVMATLAQKLGCVGMVSDGGLRDLNEVEALGFHFFAPYPVVSHANFTIVGIGVPVEIGGQRVETGDILHGDLNGIAIVPPSTLTGMEEAVTTIQQRERRNMEFIRSDAFSLAAYRDGRGY